MNWNDLIVAGTIISGLIAAAFIVAACGSAIGAPAREQQKWADEYNRKKFYVSRG